MLRNDNTNRWNDVADRCGAGWARTWAARYPFLTRGERALDFAAPGRGCRNGRRLTATLAAGRLVLRWQIGFCATPTGV